MRKILLSMFFLALVIAVAVPCEAYAIGAVSLEINGDAVVYDKDSGQPFIDNAGRMQVPFRKTMEKLGASVAWDGATKTAEAVLYGITVKIPVGAPYIIKNESMIPNDTKAQLEDGRIYLPIRAVLEAFGATVNWNSSSHAVEVASVLPLTGTTEGALTVHFINVGQGDAILIDNNDTEILIDGGGELNSGVVVNYIRPYINGSLDLVVATHEHEDHIGGLPGVFRIYQVDQVIDNGRAASAPFYTRYIDAVHNEPGCIYSTVTTAAIGLPCGAEYRILPMAGIYSYPNENSIVSLLEYGDVRMLFMGDLETTVEKNNLDQFSDTDILKVGHHGSRTATSQEFLDVANPKVSVISAGINNDFLLPNAAVIERLLEKSPSVFGTFRSGHIVLTSDGKSYSLNTGVALTTADAGAFGSTSDAAISLPEELPGEVIDPTNYVTEKEACFIGNSESKKFHTLKCEAGSKVADRRAVYFRSREDAIEEGYIPCKICNP